MSKISLRRKAASIGAAAALCAATLGGGAAVASLIQEGPFAGRGDHADVTMILARIMMARADVGNATPDPFAAQ